MANAKKYKIIKDLALIHDGGAQQLRLNVIQWERQAPKYDLRLWTNSWPEGWIPGKGLLLSDTEAERLCRALSEDLLLSALEIVKDGQNDRDPEAEQLPPDEDPEEGAQNGQNGLLTDQTENPAGE